MYDQFGEEIASAIRRLLARRELTGTELATLIGVRQQWISRRLTGVVAFNTYDLARIASALDVDPADLVISHRRRRPGRTPRRPVPVGVPDIGCACRRRASDRPQNSDNERLRNAHA